MTTLTQIPEPKTYEQTSKDPGWVAAMHTEIEALMSNKTWKFVTTSREKDHQQQMGL